MAQSDSPKRAMTAAQYSARTHSASSKIATRRSCSTRSLLDGARNTVSGFRLTRTAMGSRRREKSVAGICEKKSEAEGVFPGWLTARKDFQEIRTQYEQVDFIDIFAVCLKIASLRTDFEQQAVIKFMKSCPFFGSMKEHQLRNISERMHSIFFHSNQQLITKGAKADCLYMIVSGRVGIYIDSNKPTDEVIERNVIGEAAIHTRSIRTATVIAHGDVKALKLTYEDYDLVAFKIKLQDFNAVSAFLRSLEPLRDWNLSKLYRLASIIIVKQYERGQVMYAEGETAHDLFVVRDGEVDIKVEIEVLKKNRWPSSYGRQEVSIRSSFEKTLRRCTVGDFFGEQELVVRTPRRATALCASETCVLFLIRDEFFREIFSDRDQKSLFSRFRSRPNSGQLRAELQKERKTIMTSTEAMLDGLNTNFVPEGREIFLGASNAKQRELAKVLMKRKKTAMRRHLIRQTKTMHNLFSRYPGETTDGGRASVL